MASCAVEGGCVTDYLAIAISMLSMILLLSRFILPFVVHKVPRTKNSGFWIPVIQVFASFNLLLSIVMSLNFLKFKKRHWWQSCYVWAVWFEGPLGFGLLLSCRLTQAFQLYYIFVKRRLPPIRSYITLPLILLPWIAGAAFIHMKQPLNPRCHMGAHWIIPVVSLHTSYVSALVGFTGAVRHIDFRFDELRDLWRGILVSASSIGLWVAAYVLNEIRDDISWLQVASRFLLLIMASILVLAFFSMSSSQPLLSQISLRKRESREFGSMGEALGIPDSGLLLQREPAQVIDPNEPLDKLLLDKRFRLSFMAFADSCLAGESVHFYDEVHELGKISLDDSVRRIYMARHIIDKYIVAGAAEQMQDKEQEALRLKALAETKYNNSKLKSALKYAKRAQRLAPNLDGLSEMVTSFKILRVAAARSPDTLTPDWYKILQVEPFAHINTLKKQYKKLALVLHPDKNPYAGSEEAFKLVSEAFRFLSDRIRRKEYDMKLRIRIQEENVVGLAAADTFWTACSMCRLLHKFERRYLGHNLVCPNCKKSFEAVEVETDDGNKSGGEDAEVRVRSERLRKRNVGVVERFGDLGSKPKMGSGVMGSGMRAGELEREQDGVDRDGIWSCGRLRSWGLKRRMRTVGEVLERSMPKRAKTGEETMTLAEMQQEARRKVQQERMKEKEKDEREKRKEKEKERRRDLKKSGDLQIEKRGSSKKSGDSDIERRRKKSVGLEIERRRSSRGGDLEIMSVEDSDFYDFDKDRVERSFKKGQVWAIYDDDDGMPRHYGLIDEIVSVIPFEVKMSWLDLQSNGDEGLICLEKMGFHISCGKFKVAWKNSINSLNVFSHIVDCEQEAREVYRIYPRKGSVWALYNEAAVDAEGRNLSVKDKRCYDIVLFMTSYSEMYGLSMAYLEKVDGFKTIFKRREIGCHAIRLLEKHDLRLFSHQIPARKLSNDEAPEILKDCWELDPASLPPDLLGIGWKR